MKKILHTTVLIIFILSSIIATFACESNTEEPTPKPSPVVTPTPQVEPSPSPESAERTDPYEILITDNGIDPKTLTVPVGTTVTWYNKDTRPNSRHWMKALDGSWETRAVPHGARMRVTFNEKGTWDYECIFHRDREEEKGTIIVE
jgi:plastocyanin